MPNLLDELSEHVDAGFWLDQSNPFRRNPTVEIASSIEGATRRKRLAEYVAASAPLHLLDGWRYVGLALYALLYGANDNAKHLAYYAELRAGMSLLATQGIGLFDRIHVVIESGGSAIPMPVERATHEATWLYMRQWAGGRTAADLVGSLLQLNASPIVEWFSHMPRLGAWVPVGTDMLLAMGLDLERMATDQRGRNEASYRPSGFGGIQPSTTLPDLAFVVSLVQTLGPEIGTRPFEQLDKYLCRRIIDTAHTNAPILDDVDLPLQLDFALDELATSSYQQDRLRRFLTRGEDASDPPIIEHALQNAVHDDPQFPYQILSRSMLLLRVSTGAVRQLLSNCTLEFQHLHSWMDAVVDTHGLSDTPPIGGEDLMDLWSDIERALGVLRVWPPATGNSRRQLWSDCASAIVDVTGTTRVGLMGIV